MAVISNEGKAVNIDRDELNPGDAIVIKDLLNNDWKIATVHEIDISEREILVNYEDDSQEWISADTRKICFPPPKSATPPPPTPVKRRSSAARPDADQESNAKKTKVNIDKGSKEETSSKKEKSSRNRHTSKNVSSKTKDRSSVRTRTSKAAAEKKSVPSKPAPSSFFRIKIQSNKSEVRRRRGRRDKSKSASPHENIDDLEQDVTPFSILKKIRKPRPLRGAAMAAHIRKMRAVQNKAVTESNETIPQKVESKPDEHTESSSKTLPFVASAGKKIKTLLPKRSPVESMNEIPSPTSVSATPELPSPLPPVTPLQTVYPIANALPPVNVTPTSSRFTCPKQDCKKHFRNENLLMMHIKHYHPEYKNMLSSTPNVADLAYARTVGENIDSPQSAFLERIVRLEEDRIKEKTDREWSPSITSDTVLASDNNIDENVLQPLENSEKIPEVMKSAKVSKKSTSRRVTSSSSPLSPQISVLLAQLQEPPLVPPTISIHSENTDSEMSVSQSTPATPGSPQISSKFKSQLEPDKSPISDLEDVLSDSKKSSPSRKRRLSHLECCDVVNCTCGYGFEDGLMIQCELCLCWQHASCSGVESDGEVPSPYVCDPCLFPRLQHSSRKYAYAQNWLKLGVLPSFDFAPTLEEVAKKREQYMKRSHEMLSRLAELRNGIRSLQVKIQILRQTPDHPKLYLWAQSWDENNSAEEENEREIGVGPVPEAAINMSDCRKHLSEHIEGEMNKVESTLRSLELEIEDLEAEHEDEDNFGKELDKDKIVTKQTLLMMMRDLTYIQNLKYC